MRFTIGRFSRICGMSPKMMRYYESIGLLIPDTVNEETGYRYYASCQIDDVIFINRMKKFGFTLKEIGMLLKFRGNDITEEIVDKKIREIQKNILESEKKLEDLKNQKNSIVGKKSDTNSGNSFSIKVEMQQAVNVISIRKTINMNNISEIYDETYGKLFRHNLKPSGPLRTYYYDELFDPENADIEVCVPVKDGMGNKDIIIKKGYTTVSTVFSGEYETIPRGYAAIMEYLEKNSLKVVGTPYEKYLIGYESGLSQSEYLTEIHFPVSK